LPRLANFLLRVAKKKQKKLRVVDRYLRCVKNNAPTLASYCHYVLCDTHDTSILIVDTYVTIPVSLRSRYTAVYRSSTKYRETAQVSRVSTIPCSLYHLATCTLQACDAETNVAENHSYHSTTMSARAAVNKYNPISYFCISAALLTTLTKDTLKLHCAFPVSR